VVGSVFCAVRTGSLYKEDKCSLYNLTMPYRCLCKNRYRIKTSITTKIIYYLLLMATSFDSAMGSSSGDEHFSNFCSSPEDDLIAGSKLVALRNKQ
jgi:hypothetical protein